MKKSNKIFSCLMALMMILTVLPAGTFAEGTQDNSSVTVYLTISEDGYFVYGNDEDATAIARVPVTVDYFDLADYGLEDYYRCESDSFEDGGKYKNDVVVEQPTVLHLLITALEKYYLGGEKLEVGTEALNVSGSATSMCFNNFWGHDGNLMFLVNHKVAFMGEGMSATADYILLEDGMEIDLGMFSNYNFYYTGGFAYFDQTEYNVSVGEEVSFKTMKSNTDMFSSDFGGAPSQLGGLYTSVSDESWIEIADLSEFAYENGEFTYTFEKPGRYYVTAIDPYAGDPDNSSTAPAIAVVNVTEKEETTLEGKIYYQLKTDEEGKLRIIAELSKEDVFAANSAGITVTIEGTDYTVALKKAYNSLIANGKIVTPSEGNCFIISPVLTGIENVSEMNVEVTLDTYDNGISRTISL